MAKTSFPTMPTNSWPLPGPQPPAPAYEPAAARGGRDAWDRDLTKTPLLNAPPTAGAVKVPKRELLGVTSQMAIMTRAGVDLASCLRSIAKQSRRPSTKAMLEQIHSDVLAGNPVSDSLRRYVHVFGETFVASIAAGEASGRVSDVLDELVRFQRNDLRLRSTLRTVLAYPILLTTVSLLVIVGLVLFVLPNFSEIFEQYEMSLPALTLCLLGVSTGLRAHLWLWGGLAIVGLAGLIALRRSDAGKRAWDGAVLNMVLVRDVTRALLIGRTCRLLGIMIDSGVPLLECLRLARSSVRNTLYRDLFARLEDDVINGRGLANGLLNADFVPSAAAEMVVTAERTGAMKTVTDLIGQHYEEEGEGKLRELVALLEPAIIVVMGVVVAAVVLAVMLPMFDIATLAQKGS